MGAEILSAASSLYKMEVKDGIHYLLKSGGAVKQLFEPVRMGDASLTAFLRKNNIEAANFLPTKKPLSRESPPASIESSAIQSSARGELSAADLMSISQSMRKAVSLSSSPSSPPAVAPVVPASLIAAISGLKYDDSKLRESLVDLGNMAMLGIYALQTSVSGLSTSLEKTVRDAFMELMRSSLAAETLFADTLKNVAASFVAMPAPVVDVAAPTVNVAAPSVTVNNDVAAVDLEPLKTSIESLKPPSSYYDNVIAKNNAVIDHFDFESTPQDFPLIEGAPFTSVAPRYVKAEAAAHSCLKTYETNNEKFDDNDLGDLLSSASAGMMSYMGIHHHLNLGTDQTDIDGFFPSYPDISSLNVSSAYLSIFGAL